MQVGAPAAQVCKPDRTITADVVALDQPIMLNRLGAMIPGGMVFALRGDVTSNDTPLDANGEDSTSATPSPLAAGNVRLRSSKRPRPMVLRMNVGDCLVINFQNFLSVGQPVQPQTLTRNAGVHVTGLELVPSDPSRPSTPAQPGINSDASWVGANPGATGSLVRPGGTAVYTYYAPAEGTFFLYSLDDKNDGPGAGQWQAGLFGSVNVQPTGAEWYRSQVTHDDLLLATKRAADRSDRKQLTAGASERLMIRGEEQTNVETTSVPARGAAQARVTTNEARVDDKSNQKVGTLLTPLPGRLTSKESPVVEVTQASTPGGSRLFTIDGHPIIDYNALYPADDPKVSRRCTPILKMLDFQYRVSGGVCQPDMSRPKKLYHSDLMAIITGPGGDRFPTTSVGPLFSANPANPDRRQPYREFTIFYHDAGNTAVQAFQLYNSGPLARTLANGKDNFGINYGMGGIGSEILANRFGVGPSRDCADCKFEEFFLSAWVVGDPAQVVDNPASVQVDAAGRRLPDAPKATKVLYPDDPSNVYHSYMRDHVKFRIHNASTGAPHVHHQHAHQWLHTPNSDNSRYLDSQMVIPGSSYTLEMDYNGSGNRNQTVGDSIFHCHFYPHFAQGMWSLWRVHDVFEAGSKLDAAGRPVVNQLNPDGTLRPGGSTWNRSLPDGEIVTGTPIPAIVPLPTLGMAPVPSSIALADNGTRVVVVPDTDAEGRILKTPDGRNVYKSPGFPLFIPGIAGRRAPHPPLDFAWQEDAQGQPIIDPATGDKVRLDGGLPRHLVLDGKVVREFHTKWDFSKDFAVLDHSEKLVAGGLTAFQLPEEGTEIEKVAMQMHARRTHPTYQPDGEPGNFILNGLPPVPGAPFSRPDVDDEGNAVMNTRRYKAANIQRDVVFNKKGWHFPQQRMIALWGDVQPIMNGTRPPEPFFFRANTGESIEFWHTNLVPNYYELDDFQVRTPTDIMGQHIHLVKFDVLASDGAANGYNYEDGTFSPDDVRERIAAINGMGGTAGLFSDKRTIDNCLNSTQPAATCIAQSSRTILQVKKARDAYGGIFGTPPAGQNWDGAQTTVQRWDTDPTLNNAGVDRTLRTTFTHDHFGPSTHQQAGLYAGLLVEPENSKWLHMSTGKPLYDAADPARQRDGGPTSWQAMIITADPDKSYREFALEFQDLQLAYTAQSTSVPRPITTALTGAAAALFSTSTNFQTCLSTPGCLSTTDGARLLSQFASNGAPISPQATVSGPATGPWTITDNGVNVFTLTSAPAGCTSTTCRQQVVVSSMHPTWMDNANALSPAAASPAFAPGLISFAVNGTYSLNYRNEPLPLRLMDSTCNPSGGSTPCVTASGNAGDLSFVFNSMQRADAALNKQPDNGGAINPANPSGFKFPKNPLVPEAAPLDPYTPLLQAYQNDRVQIRTLVGAHFQTHPFAVHGLKWLFEPDDPNSGYKSVQGMGLSEHFEMIFKMPAGTTTTNSTAKQPFTDYLYAPSSSITGITNGLWGLLRVYDGKTRAAGELPRLPNNPAGTAPSVPACPRNASNFGNPRKFVVIATTAGQVLPGGQVVYNSRGQVTTLNPMSPPANPVVNKNALIYVNQSDLDPATGKLKAGRNVEPLILRANAGECIQITLLNQLPTPTATPFLPIGLVRPFGARGGQPLKNIQTLPTSLNVGLHAQIVAYDTAKASGLNVGSNQSQTIPPGAPPAIFTPHPDGCAAGEANCQQINWYAGNLVVRSRNASPSAVASAEAGTAVADTGSANKVSEPDPANTIIEGVPVEFGSVNLLPGDPLAQPQQGLIGALIIEPRNTRSVVEDPNTHASATVTLSDGTSFREFVVVSQTQGVPGGSTAVNYKTEPFTLRYPTGNSNSSVLFPVTTAVPGIVTALQKGQVNSDLQTAFANANFKISATTASTLWAWTLPAGAAVGSGFLVTQNGGRLNVFTNANALSNAANNSNQNLNPNPLGSPATNPWLFSVPATAADVSALKSGTVTANLQSAFNKRGVGAPPTTASDNSMWQVEQGGYTYLVSANQPTSPTSLNVYLAKDISGQLSNSLLPTNGATPPKFLDPETPVFAAEVGQPVRFRVLYPFGDNSSDQVVAVHGHVWQEEPYATVNGAAVIGDNPLSQWMGNQMLPPGEHLEIVLNRAGGSFATTGDYLYHSLLKTFQGGWGIMRVCARGADCVRVTASVVTPEKEKPQLAVVGRNTVNPSNGRYAESVKVSLVSASGAVTELGSARVGQDGSWELRLDGVKVEPGDSVRVESSEGGVSAPARIAFDK